MVGVMFPLRSTLAVPADSPIKTICDAKGKRMGNKFTAQTILQLTQSTLLSTCNIKQEDMSDKIALLKKVELKFQSLMDMRKVFNHFDAPKLKTVSEKVKKAQKDHQMAK